MKQNSRADRKAEIGGQGGGTNEGVVPGRQRRVKVLRRLGTHTLLLKVRRLENQAAGIMDRAFEVRLVIGERIHGAES